MASAARTVILAQALHMAREPVKSFLESAGNGPLAAKAVETAAATAAAFPLAHDAVQSILEAGGGGAAAGGGGGLPSTAVTEGGGEIGDGSGSSSGVMKSAAVKEDGGDGGRTAGLVSSEVRVNRGSGGVGAGVAAAEEVLAMEREDSAARVSACQEAMEGWWERQRAAVGEGLQDREAEAADRR